VLAAFAAKRDTYLNSRDENKELDSIALPSGQVIRIVRGNIVEQEVDAIVSMSDDRLSMSGDASKIIAAAGGPDLRQRVKELAPVRPGRAVVTPGAALPSRFVIHGVIFGNRDDSGIRSNAWMLPSKELITEVVSSCFYEAESHKLVSVAFPLSTKGTMGISPQDGLDTLFRAILRSLSRGAASVREVRIVIYD
jgi:O-acetyl-ADP-ribose deacetylase (regulator of RNase III)